MDPASLLLASASPRRRRLIEWIRPDVPVISADTDEDLTGPLKSLPPILARSIAADKARTARALILADRKGDSHEAALPVILAFDTIVTHDRAVLGKPRDLEEARGMLEALSGETHQVITGVAVLRPEDDDPVTFAVTTPVSMHKLGEAQLSEWLAGDEVLGCAGAYNIERHLASVGEGECYQNVAGLPLCHLYRELTRLGVAGLSSPVAACEAARGTNCELGAALASRAGRDSPPTA